MNVAEIRSNSRKSTCKSPALWTVKMTQDMLKLLNFTTSNCKRFMKLDAKFPRHAEICHSFGAFFWHPHCLWAMSRWVLLPWLSKSLVAVFWSKPWWTSPKMIHSPNISQPSAWLLPHLHGVSEHSCSQGLQSTSLKKPMKNWMAWSRWENPKETHGVYFLQSGGCPDFSEAPPWFFVELFEVHHGLLSHSHGSNFFNLAMIIPSLTDAKQAFVRPLSELGVILKVYVSWMVIRNLSKNSAEILHG